MTAAASEIEAVRRIIRTVVAPRAQRLDATGVFPREVIRQLGAAGAGGLLMPVGLGGQGRPVREYAEAVELLANACGGTSTVYMTQMHSAHPIHLRGTEAQARHWIPRICAGDAIGAIALTEPDAGSDVAAMRTTASADRGGYRLNGTKTFISNGDVADVIVLFATVDPHRGKDGVTAFLVETAGLEGFTAGRPMEKLGQKAASTVELAFDDCWIPESWRLGDEGDGYALLLASVLNSRISAAAQGIGFAQGAFDDTAARLLELGLLSAARRDAQDVQFALADIEARIVAARALLVRACDLVDAKDPGAAVEVSKAKMHCTALGVQVANECVSLLGDDGDRIDLGVERRLRDAKITEIYDGTNQVQSMLVARRVRQVAEQNRVGG